MFAGNAAGQYFPPFVVYKSENIYREWVRGGQANTVYECTKNGWFDLRTFEVWFFKQFSPSTDVAVFQPTKIEWKDILDTWRRESKCMDNLPKMVFPSLLYKLMRRLQERKLGVWFSSKWHVPIR